jgi:hypothetical protein
VIGDAIAAVLGKVIDRAWPDPLQREAAARALLELQQAGEFKAIDAELQAMQMQAQVNQVEAASEHLFVSGWRPFIGWTCGAAFAWHFVGRPLANWVILVSGADTLVPEVEMGDLLVVLLGMLGLGGLRTAEKFKGVAAR